jgi:enamine deaminase RidA (YjgF/YER057c/UK114 family)
MRSVTTCSTLAGNWHRSRVRRNNLGTPTAGYTDGSMPRIKIRHRIDADLESAERSIVAARHRRAIRRSVHHAAMAKRQLVSSGAPWEPLVGYSRAVRVGQWVAVAGTTAAAEGGGAVGGDDIGEQTREALKRIKAALEQAGARLDDVVRTRMFVTDISRWEEVGRAHGEIFAAVRPATSMLEISSLIDPALLVEIEADAIVP